MRRVRRETLRNPHTPVSRCGLLCEGFLHVVDEGQRHLVHVGALVRQEAAPLEMRRSGTTRIHDWPGRRVASPWGG